MNRRGRETNDRAVVVGDPHGEALSAEDGFHIASLLRSPVGLVTKVEEFISHRIAEGSVYRLPGPQGQCDDGRSIPFLEYPDADHRNSLAWIR